MQKETETLARKLYDIGRQAAGEKKGVNFPVCFWEQLAPHIIAGNLAIAEYVLKNYQPREKPNPPNH